MTPLRGDLQRVDFEGQATVVVVNREGILVVDPLNATVASWMHAEFEKRFPGVPVRYVVYTHHRFDRSSGAGAFDKAAEIVAHERFADEWQRGASRLPAELVTFDVNRDGAIDAKERSGLRRDAVLATFDRDSDGTVTVLELYGGIASPESAYASRRTIALGNRTIELQYVPTSGAADMTAVYFPAERVLFTAGPIGLQSLPSTLGPSPASALAAARRLEALEFDTIVTGDGQVGTKAELAVFRQYLEELSMGVRAGFASGRTADEIASTLPLNRFVGLSNLATQRPRHVAEFYAALRPVTTSIRAVAQMSLFRIAPDTCDARIYQTCETNVALPWVSGMGGFHTSIGRWLIGAELAANRTATRHVQWGPGSFSLRESLLQHRTTIVTALAGYSVVEKPGFTATIETGPSFIFSKGRHTVFAGPGGSVAIGGTDGESLDHAAMGWTVGASLVPSISPRVAIVLPVRLTVGDRGLDEVGSVSLSFGAGFTFNVGNGVR